jgi:uncharacterized protein (TIGR02284 family)
MAERTSREVLNDLIQTCTDGERGFRAAADLVTRPVLKTLFLELSTQRARFADELLPHAQRLGGTAPSEGTTAASMHRRWMDLKSALTSHDEHAIVTEVRRGDAATLRVYSDALAGLLPPTARDLVERQDEEIRAAHERIEAAARERLTQTLL